MQSRQKPESPNGLSLVALLPASFQIKCFSSRGEECQDFALNIFAAARRKPVSAVKLIGNRREHFYFVFRACETLITFVRCQSELVSLNNLFPRSLQNPMRLMHISVAGI
jgi:hypothetical protein